MFSEKVMLREHLKHNCIPDMTRYLDLAQEALTLARFDEWSAILNHEYLELPIDLRVAQVITGLHLEGFIMEEV